MFSVIVPLYNKEVSIKNTIESVLNQKYQKFEVIVVNDGSTDNSAKIVESIDDDRVRLIHKKNQGVSVARNRGIMEAKCEWIAFLDGDDLWEKDDLQELIEMMHILPNYKVYVTSFKFSDDRIMFKHERSRNIFKIENYYREAMYEDLIWTSIIVINKACFDKVGCFNPQLNRGEDVDLWARLAKHYTIIKSSKVSATYRVDAENRTSLSKDIERLHVYHYDLIKYEDDEFDYYERLVLNHLLLYIFAKDYVSFKRIKDRHPDISFLRFIIHSTKELSPHLLRKIKGYI